MTEFPLLQWISTFFGVWKIRNYVANLPITFLSLATTKLRTYFQVPDFGIKKLVNSRADVMLFSKIRLNFTIGRSFCF